MERLKKFLHGISDRKHRKKNVKGQHEGEAISCSSSPTIASHRPNALSYPLSLQMPSQDGSSLPESEHQSRINTRALQIQNQLDIFQDNKLTQMSQLLAALTQGTPDQRASAAEALFNITSESEAFKQQSTTLGTIPALLELLITGNEHAKMYAAYTLSALTSIDEAAQQMLANNAVQLLVQTLSASSMLVCKKGAMRALGRLVRYDEAARALVRCGGLHVILPLLQSSDSNLVRRCLITLYFVGADKGDMQEEIAAADAVPLLLALCTSNNQDIAAEAVDSVKVLCKSAACGRAILQHQGWQILSEIAAMPATAGSTAGRARAAAARCLTRLQAQPDLAAALEAVQQEEQEQQQAQQQQAAQHQAQQQPASAFGAAAGSSEQQGLQLNGEMWAREAPGRPEEVTPASPLVSR